VTALVLRVFAMSGVGAFCYLAGLRRGERTETWVTSWWALLGVACIFLFAGALAIAVDAHSRLIAARRRPRPPVAETTHVHPVPAPPAWVNNHTHPHQHEAVA
jgi:Na+-transporting methylmalonyl-CoA/oxaloacetate decarboxylase gamma subunit